ncbi:hypothetical protein ONZ43_g985 [Nemania bipapillata]|uniref:Uncharacterized protein n=1 Tax=Nemania bipapillata TaxID=110536 RepID=A0ACC2J621_9PEZI|nr:hypothetical protein ONZ43_g985 [Nemania bipapillata]
MFSANAQPVTRNASYNFGLGTVVYDMGIMDLLTAAKTPEEFERIQKLFYDRTKDANAFSDVFPQHRYNVVHSLENNGRGVAVTGSSASECLVLRRATVSISVCGASNGARAAADLVCYNQGVGLGSIAKAITISRMVFNTLIIQITYWIAVVCHTLFCFASWALLSIGWDSSRRVEMLDANPVALTALFSDCFLYAAGADMTISSFTPFSWKQLGPFKTAITAATLLVFCTYITMVTIPVSLSEFSLASHPLGSNLGH